MKWNRIAWAVTPRYVLLDGATANGAGTDLDAWAIGDTGC